MKEYDIYLPLSFNDGTPIPGDTISSIKQTLIQDFGGLTDFRHRNEGTWRVGKVTYRDDVLILRVLT